VISPPIYHDEVLTDEDWNDEAVRIIENDEPTDKDPVISKAVPLLVRKAKAKRAALEFVQNEKVGVVSYHLAHYDTDEPLVSGLTLTWSPRFLIQILARSAMATLRRQRVG
jgi:hypothetical protein